MTTNNAERGLTNEYINALGSRLFHNHPTMRWLGVYSCDRLPQLVPEYSNFVMIINMALSHQPHGHFITLGRRHGRLYVFDPLNLPIRDLNIEKFIRTTLLDSSRTMIRDYPQIQHNNSSFCGYFCVAFAIALAIERRIYNFFTHFLPDQQRSNDQVAVMYITRAVRYIL